MSRSNGNGAAPSRTDHLPAPAERKILESTSEPEASQLLTAEQLALRWQLPGGKAAIYRMTRANQIPTVRLGKFYRYRLQEILNFEANGGTKATLNGTIVFVSANGDELTGTFSGFVSTLTGQIGIQGPITGGTGRFENATGFFGVRGSHETSFPDGEHFTSIFEFPIIGVISY